MPSRVTCWFRIIAVSLVLGLCGCSDDDDPVGPESGFVLTVEVTTVAGLRGALSPDLDVAGTVVRTLIGPEDEPPYDQVWDGCDDDGETVHNGVYRHLLEFYDEDENLEVSNTQLVLITGDPDHHAVVFDAEPVPQTLTVTWNPR